MGKKFRIMGIGVPCSYIRAHYTILLIDDGVVCSDEYPYHVYLCLQSLPSVDNLLQKGFKFSTSVGWVSTFEHTSWYWYWLFSKTSYQPAIGLKKTFTPAWSGYQGSKADLWLVFGKCIYISGIDIDIALSGIKLISPQVPTRQVREEAGIASGDTSLVSSLIAALEVLVSIPGFDQGSNFQLVGTCPTLVSTCISCWCFPFWLLCVCWLEEPTKLRSWTWLLMYILSVVKGRRELPFLTSGFCQTAQLNFTTLVNLWTDEYT